MADNTIGLFIGTGLNISRAERNVFTIVEIASMEINGVWAMEQKVQGYSGPLWKIRRSSDNVTASCYSLAEAVAHIGAGTGYVHTWYDQSGYGKNFTETDVNYQPAFTASDSTVGGKPSLDFQSNDGMIGSYTSTANSGSTYCAMYTFYYGQGGAHRVLGAQDDNWLLGPYGGKHQIHTNGFSDGPASTLNVPILGVAWRATGSAIFNFRVNGAVAGNTSPNLTPRIMNLGVRGMFGESAGSRIHQLVFAQTGTENNTTKIAAIEAKMNMGYNLY